MRSMVAGPSNGRVSLSLSSCSLLPHNSSSSHTRFVLSRRTISSHIATAGNSSRDWYSASNDSSSGSSGGGGTQSGPDSDGTKRARSRHYYESTPKYKSRGSNRTDADASVSDAVADALSASFGDISSSRSRSSRDSSSSSSRGGRAGRGRSRGGVSTADGYVDDLDDDADNEVQGLGWWEVPREQRWSSSSSAAIAADPAELRLEPWQEKQLLLAAASSKKKMQVQTVAANVGLDRTEVLAWVAAFRAKPKSEQSKLLEPLQQQIQQMKTQQQAQSDAAQAAEAARRGRGRPQQHQQRWEGQEGEDVAPRQQQQQRQQRQSQEQEEDGSPRQQQQQQLSEEQEEDVAPRQQRQQQQGLPFSGKNPDTGFLPYTERRGSSSGRKRLSGEVLRTLEGVYARSPWPNKEIVAGLFDLHRLPRDTVLDWFTARREMDGLPDNPRAAKQLAATAKRALHPLQPLLPSDMLPQQQQPKQQTPPPAAADAAAGGQQQQKQQQERVRMQSLTAREMAALRSGLPSPRKQKGEKLKQELGVKAGPDASKQLEIAGVTFVAKDGRAGWRNAWRKRRSATGVPAQQLDFNLWFIRQEQQQDQQEQEQQQQQA